MEGDEVLVHSSMRKVGPVDGGAQTVLEALLEVVGPEGTVLFPTHTGHEACSPQNPPPFDARTTPSLGMGVLAEIARQHPQAVRSLNPSHSVCAIGHMAEWLCKAHHLAETPCGTDSPYERLARVGGKILLLGCDQENNTSLHWLEEKAHVPYHMLLGAAEYEVIDQQGNSVPIAARFHRWGDARAFHRVDSILRANGAQNDGMVGQAEARLISSARMDELISPILLAEPSFLLAAYTPKTPL